MSKPFEPLDRCGRLPAEGDNVAIATRRLEAGTRIRLEAGACELAHTVLEGHRFVVAPIGRGDHLLSWGLPFGRATRELSPGEYVCNARILEVLAERDVELELPDTHCFIDAREQVSFDLEDFVPGEQVAPHPEPGTFRGYPRTGGRGVGTRNHIVVLAVTSRVNAFVDALARRCSDSHRSHPGCDGIVSVPHTEGGSAGAQNNQSFVLRALAGFIVHPNVGAVLVVDDGEGAWTSTQLEGFLSAGGYPLEHVRHELFTLGLGVEAELERAEQVLEAWLPEVAADERQAVPLSGLKIALQCGGSDAFSGVSGNALAGSVAKELIRHGGSANLAETDELIGAEPYVLSNVKDSATALRFLEKINHFQERASHHGASAEGNPSGGNNYRGLYNLALKSIGAARKKDPDVRLDRVLDYAEPMSDGGFHFMDSPGNDLESIAGQVGSGANLIFFITGNGSITNFPFVPTLKFVTTSGRFRLLEGEMDVNAGRYNDGESMDSLAAETFELTTRVASGERTKGEAAGHSQVSIWRDWRQTGSVSLAELRARPAPAGTPLLARAATPAPIEFDGLALRDGVAADQVGLVVPTSLCSGQIARELAARLDARSERPGGVSRFVALVHSEGCGSAGAEELYMETMVGHLAHPFVRRALLLEHGCEKTHNDAFRRELEQRGIDQSRLGFASVQLDGGMEAVIGRALEWFDESLESDGPVRSAQGAARDISLGLVATSAVPEAVARDLGALAAAWSAAGVTLVLAEDELLDSEAFRASLLAGAGAKPEPTIAYGAAAAGGGVHIMQTPTSDPLEVLTGLGGTGVSAILAVGVTPRSGHPLVPVVSISTGAHPDADVCWSAAAADPAGAVAEQLALTLSRRDRPRLLRAGQVDFQLTRGELGVSL